MDLAGTAILTLAIWLLLALFYYHRNKRPPLDSSDRKFNKKELQKLIHTVISMQMKYSQKPSIILCPKIANRAPERYIRQLYGIPESVICQINCDDLKGTPGKVRKIGFANYEISIDQPFQYGSVARAAILAHEYAHIWLDLHEINRESIELNERLTDVAAVFLGGGLLILQAVEESYDYNVDSVTHSRRRLGYLSISEFCYVFNAQCLWTENDIFFGDLKCMPAIVKRAFDTVLKEEEVKPKQISSNEHFLIVQCNNCFQQVRIPKKKKLRIICPICKTEHIVEQEPSGQVEFKRVIH